jgi:hypothetical protein
VVVVVCPNKACQLVTANTDVIRILTVDDHPVLREGIAALVAGQPDMKVIAECSNGREAIQQFRTHRPEITLMDLQMPEMNGLVVVQIILGILLMVGLWTPVAGTLLAILEVWHLVSLTGDPWIHILLLTLGVSLALLGPGGWSIDARLFGWKRVDISRSPSQRFGDSPPR